MLRTTTRPPRRTPLLAVGALALGLGAVQAGAGEPCHFTQISAGFPNCGLLLDGTAHCWGDPASPNGEFATPPAGTFVAVSAGLFHACGLRGDGSVECWGWTCAYYGEPGPSQRWECLDFSGDRMPPSGPFSQISAGDSHTCGLRPSGAIECWGGEGGFSAGTPPSGTFAKVESGMATSCALTTDGQLRCWGFGVEFGNNTPPAPDVTPPIELFTDVSTGTFHSCALRAGAAECWGGYGRLHGQTLPPGGTFTQLSTSFFNSCGLRSDGTIECWGLNDAGQSTPPPGQFVQISGNCALRADGTADCWGVGAASGLVECSICGNGILADHEGCDDNNLIDGDGCDSNCTVTGCGNGIVTTGEICDDGNRVETDKCESDCTRPPTWCGDGIPQELTEACDDGNETDNDGCESDCTVSPPFCGNGVLTSDEECDDGNLTPGDGCDENCVADCPPLPHQAACYAMSRADMSLTDKSNDASDSFTWKWRGGPVLDDSVPHAQARYQFCFYPDDGPLAGSVRIRGASGWLYRTNGQFYGDDKLLRSSIQKMDFGWGSEGKARLTVKARGVDLPDSLLPTTSYTVELHERKAGTCWASTFPAGTLKPGRFRARVVAP